MRRHIDACPGPIVQIWGWPGSGKRLLLKELLDAGALEISPADLAAQPSLKAAVERARTVGLPYLVCRKWPSPNTGVLDVLPSSPLLVFTSRQRQFVDPDSASLIWPETLLLEPEEAAGLWLSVTGSEPGEEELQAALEATGGWYEPLRLLASGRKEGRLPSTSASDRSADLLADLLADLPADLATFLQELLERARSDGADGLQNLGFSTDLQGLPPILRQVLMAAPAKGPGRGFAGRGTSARPTSPKDFPVRTLIHAPQGKGRFRAQFLGMPQVWRLGEKDEATEVRWMVRRSLKIFAYLATNPDRRGTKADLVAMAFQDEPIEVVNKNFHPTLSHLRRGLRAEGSHVQPLVQKAGTYFLAPEMEWDIDVDRLLEGARHVETLRDAGELEEAARIGAHTWSLYKGPFLDGEEDAWILDRRETLHRTYLRLLRDLGGVYASLERTRESLDAFRAVLLEDPLQETVQTAVMGIYASLGRRDLVRRQYDRLSKLLVAELGVEPLPETTFEYHRLMG